LRHNNYGQKEQIYAVDENKPEPVVIADSWRQQAEISKDVEFSK
jgi:hypothetical protein